MDKLVAQLSAGWSAANTRLIDRVRELRPDELGFRTGPAYWPIWAIIGHLAVARVYWVCHVLKEPGAATTPFTDPSGEGWEDHLDTPRRVDELVMALESSWRIVEKWLGRWTPESLDKTFPRERNGTVEWHTYEYVFMRLVMHDAYHAGEVSLILGMHGLPAVEPWSGLQVPAPG